jgi:DnaJ family protein B protein 4
LRSALHARVDRALFSTTDDLIHKRKVTLTEALCGLQVQVMSLDNRQINVDCTSQTIAPGDRKVVRGEGLPKKGHPGVKGDLILEFEVLFPKGALSAAQKQAVQALRLAY